MFVYVCFACFAFAVLCFPCFAYFGCVRPFLRCSRTGAPSTIKTMLSVVAFTCRRNTKKIGIGPEDLARAVYKYLLGASHKSYTLKLFEYILKF